MTVQSQTSRADYTGNGATTNFAVPFYFLANTDLLVLRTDHAAILVTTQTLVLGTDYTVSGAGNPAGGSITLSAAPSASMSLAILRNVPYTQLADYVPNDPFPAESHERALDKLTMEVQQLAEVQSRALTLSPSTTGTSTVLPPPAANQIIGWNEDGDALQNVDPGTMATIVAYGTARVDQFSGNGAVKNFVLSANPGALANLDVSVGGVDQRAGIDYSWTGGTTLSFTTAPATGTNNIQVKYMLALPQGTSDSAAATFLQAGVGAVPRPVQDELRESVKVTQYGAVAGGVVDCTAAIQRAITYAAQQYANGSWFLGNLYAAPRVVDFPSGVYKISGKLLLPAGVILRGNNSTLIGTGWTVSDNIGIETAYFNAGVLTSNIGTAPESQRLQFSIIEGFKFLNFKTALNLYNFNDGCRVADCAFADCGQAIIADRSFYAQFFNLMYRNVAAPANALPCFDFRTFVNVELLESIFCTGRTLAFQFSTGVNGLTLRNLSAENCATGIKFLGEVNPMTITGCYFEGLTGTALDFTDASAHRAVSIDDNWFNNIGTCLAGVQMLGGRFGRGNYFVGTIGTKVSITDNVSTIKVELPFSRVSHTAGSLRPAIASGYSLGAGCWVEQPSQIFDNGTGVTVAQQNYSSSPAPLPFSGQQGFAANKVLFCDHSSSGGTTFNILVDTKIVLDGYVMTIFALYITDNAGSFVIQGRAYGGNVYLDLASGKTVTASNNGGFLRLTLSSFSHPSGTYTCEGVVRMV